MKKNKVIFILVVGVFLVLGGGIPLFSMDRMDREAWLSHPPFKWESKNPELAEEWAKMIGFKAPDVVGKKAPEIKPGMIIDGNNYKNYPGLEKLLSPGQWKRMDLNSYGPLSPLKIVETNQYHFSKGFIEKTIKNMKTCKIGADGITMEGYIGGIPFPYPKSGLELGWNLDQKYLGDTCFMNPMWIRLYGRNNRPERDMKWYLGQVRWSNRTDWGEDFKPNPEGINFTGSGWFFYPRDISGSCFVRRKFLASDKPDEFMLYIPSMRRIRRLSGRDTQDPIFGADVNWDDFQQFYQKISPTDFPIEWKILEETEILAPSLIHSDYRKGEERPSDSFVDDSGDQTWLYFVSWQRRPVYVVESKELDNRYVYSKRILYVDREAMYPVIQENYDQAGRFWHSWVRDWMIENHTGYFMENFSDIVDFLNDHRTILDCKGITNPEWIGREYSELKFVIRKSK